jgi:hypothetical protein
MTPNEYTARPATLPRQLKVAGPRHRHECNLGPGLPERQRQGRARAHQAGVGAASGSAHCMQSCASADARSYGQRAHGPCPGPCAHRHSCSRSCTLRGPPARATWPARARRVGRSAQPPLARGRKLILLRWLPAAKQPTHACSAVCSHDRRPARCRPACHASTRALPCTEPPHVHRPPASNLVRGHSRHLDM